MSTGGVPSNKQMLHDSCMNIGGRIIQRLGAIEKDRQWLLGKVENLSDQALSNLIRRDSRRSEWDEAIAAALGVSVLWLVYGKDQEEHLVREEHGVYQLFSDATREVIDTMEALEPERQREVAVFARERMTLQNADPKNSTQRARK